MTTLQEGATSSDNCTHFLPDRRFTFALDEEKHPPGQPLDYSSGITLNVKGGVWVKPIAR